MGTLFLPSQYFSQGPAYPGHTSGSKGLLPESGKAETCWPGCRRVSNVLGGGGRSHGQVSPGGDAWAKTCGSRLLAGRRR